MLTTGSGICWHGGACSTLDSALSMRSARQHLVHSQNSRSY